MLNETTNPKSHARLRKLTGAQLASLMVEEYLRTRDPRAIQLLQDAFPGPDWLAIIRQLERDQASDHVTVTE